MKRFCLMMVVCMALSEGRRDQLSMRRRGIYSEKDDSFVKSGETEAVSRESHRHQFENGRRTRTWNPNIRRSPERRRPAVVEDRIVWPSDPTEDDNRQTTRAQPIIFPSDFHRNKPNERQPVFPSIPTSAPVTEASTEPEEIPVDMIQRLNNVNISELFNTYIRNADLLEDQEGNFSIIVKGLDHNDSSIMNSKTLHWLTYGPQQESKHGATETRFGFEKKTIAIAEAAHCKPELQTIKLQTKSEPSIFYFPACTRIEQCGGCCNHELLSCQPTEIRKIEVQVIKTKYISATQTVDYLGKEVMKLDKHVKCKCDCSVKKEDCNINQEYRPNECRCVCANYEDQQKCNADNKTKFWDLITCTCKCRYIQECTTFSYFDHNTCSCTDIPKKRIEAVLTREAVMNRHGNLDIMKEEDKSEMLKPLKSMARNKIIHHKVPEEIQMSRREHGSDISSRRWRSHRRN